MNPMADEIAVCNQQGCGKPAAFRFTWPGKDEAGVCGGHATALLGVASALGLHLQLIPLRCETLIKGEQCALQAGHEGKHMWGSGD